MLTRDELRDRLADLVSQATDGELTVAEVRQGTILSDLGFGSLGLLRLVDAVELEFGVELDLNHDADALRTVDHLADWLVRARG